MVVGLALIIIILQLLSSLCEAQTDDQGAALWAIKQAVGLHSPNLASWINSSSSSPCKDTWEGVTCNSQSKITGLNMSRFDLQGVLPSDAFTNLTSLQSLDLSHNLLASPLPHTLDQLTELHYLNLSRNVINESFPTSLLSLTNLLDLRIEDNFFQGSLPEGISKLENLEQLWIGNSSFSGTFPKSLSSLTRVTFLTAWGLHINMTLPPDWSVWVNLTFLNLHDGHLFGPLPREWGQNFTKLHTLHLYSNSLTGNIPDEWKGMTSLKDLYVPRDNTVLTRKNKAVNDRVLSPGLCSLSVAPAPPRKWIRQMEYNDLTGDVPTWVSRLEQSNVTQVDFSCNYLTGPAQNQSASSSWKGNCFANSSFEHGHYCKGDTCTDFLRKLVKSSGPASSPASFSKAASSPRAASLPKAASFPKAAIIGMVIGILVICSILAMAWRLKKVYGKKRKNDDGDWEAPQGVRRFTLREITKVTNSFDESCKIGGGGFGKVYVALLEDGKNVAIKRGSGLTTQGTKEFHNEIALLSRLHHRHLVRLEGFCDGKNEQILVYEYMKNGNLHHHLFGKNTATLNWYRRLEIAVAVAEGLDYLHTFADPPIIHRDVKPTNILLDENMIAKVSDFGISKANPEIDTHVSTRPAGTAGYWDPEYFFRHQLTTASDVYGYGVVLLELLTGQVAINHKRPGDYHLVGWVKPKFQTEGIESIIDPEIKPNYHVKAYTEVAELAIMCTSFERAQRPTMQDIVSTLKGILSKLTPPAGHKLPVSQVYNPHSRGLTSIEASSDSQITELEPR